MKKWISELKVVEKQSRSLIEAALVENGGILINVIEVIGWIH